MVKIFDWKIADYINAMGVSVATFKVIQYTISVYKDGWPRMMLVQILMSFGAKVLTLFFLNIVKVATPALWTTVLLYSIKKNWQSNSLWRNVVEFSTLKSFLKSIVLDRFYGNSKKIFPLAIINTQERSSNLVFVILQSRLV